jgi:hypothetical protein
MLLTLLQSSGAGPSAQTITQSARFDNAQTFYGGTVTQPGGAQTVTQTARFDNAQTFYGGAVTTLRTVSQSSRFNNTQAFYGGVVTTLRGVVQDSRFNNNQTFYGGVVTQPSGPQSVTQATRFNNAQIFYGGTVTQPGVQPTSQAGGSGGVAPRRRKRPEWENWRAQERARLESLLRGEDTTPEVQQAAATLSTSAEPRAQRIARKLTNYTGQLDQLKSLQRDIAKLEVDIQQRRIADENYQALQQAAAELSAVMQDDEDFLATYADYERQEAELLFAALGGRLLS